MSRGLETDEDFSRAVEAYEDRQIMNELTGRCYDDNRGRMNDDDRAYEADNDKRIMDKIRERSVRRRVNDYR